MKNTLWSIENIWLLPDKEKGKEKISKTKLEIDYLEKKLKNDSDSSSENSSDSEITVYKELSDNNECSNMKTAKAIVSSDYITPDLVATLDEEKESLIIQQSLEQYEWDPIMDSAEIYELFSNTIFEEKKNELNIENNEALWDLEDKENFTPKFDNKKKGRPKNTSVATKNDKIKRITYCVRQLIKMQVERRKIYDSPFFIRESCELPFINDEPYLESTLIHRLDNYARAAGF